MKLKKLPIICATLACLMFTLNAFGEEQQSFIRKVLRGGPVTQSIQTRDGNYAYLNDSYWYPGKLNGGKIARINDLSGKTLSEVSTSCSSDPAHSRCSSNANSCAPGISGCDAYYI